MRYRPFVLVSYPRSGTHLLRTALESHPAVRCQAEPFNSDDRRLPYPLETPAAAILARWVFPPDLPASVAAAGFVLQAYHPAALEAFPGIRPNPRWTEVWDLLRAIDSLAVLHLRRRDLLARHLSHLTSRATGKWHQWRRDAVARASHLAPVPPGEIGPRQAPPPRLTVDPERLRLDFEEQERWHRRAEERLAGLPRCEIAYEDLAAGTGQTYDRVQRFLGLELRDLTPAVEKLERRTTRSAIANYAQLAARFRGSRWEFHFPPAAEPAPQSAKT